MQWPDFWTPIENADQKAAAEAELQRELKPGHPLFGIPLSAIAQNQDDVLFEYQDGSGRVAEVHLTYAGERERPPWPGTSIFDSFADWLDSWVEEL